LAMVDGFYPNRYRHFCQHHLSDHNKFHDLSTLKERRRNLYESTWKIAGKGRDYTTIYYHNADGIDKGNYIFSWSCNIIGKLIYALIIYLKPPACR